MSTVLAVCQSVANLEHIGVVPVSRAGVLAQALVHLHDLQYAERFPLRLAVLVVGLRDGKEGRADVAGRPPGMSHVRRPFPRLGGAPLAHAEQDRTPGLAQGAAHQGIGSFGIEVVGVAPVVFEVVHAPGGISIGILVLVAEAACIAGAGVGPGIAVDAELETARVQVVGQRLDPGGELDGIFVDKSPLVPLSVPSVVEVEIDVAGVDEPQLDHFVRRGLDQVFVDVGGELVPGIPPHLGRLSQPLPLGERLVRTAALGGEDGRHGETEQYGQDQSFHIWILLVVNRLR